MSKVTGKSIILGVIGDPIEHSLSPLMHNAALESLGLNYIYLPFHVKPEFLKGAVKSLKALEIRGINVTIPHKVAIMEYLDEIDEAALDIGAVNTVVNDNGKLKGYNTDGAGYLKSLTSETGFDAKGKNILVLGAGGASLAVITALLSEHPKSLHIVNRTFKKAKTLVNKFIIKYPDIDILAISLEEWIREGLSMSYDLAVNTTSIGMKGEIPKMVLPFKVDQLPSHAIVSDIVYTPFETPMLKEANDIGLKTHYGLGMLLHQGAISFKLFTGATPPIEIMKDALLSGLNSK